MAKKPTLEQVEASIARWKTRLKRAMTALDKLEKQQKRLVKAAAQPRVISDAPAKPEPLAVTIMKELAAPQPVQPARDPSQEAERLMGRPGRGGAGDDDIPAFLRRQSSDPDPVAEQIKAEQAETKAAKARGRIAKMKAKKSGETKKMPLSGRAALDAIRNG
jgi:hypothetical protein